MIPKDAQRTFCQLSSVFWRHSQRNGNKDSDSVSTNSIPYSKYYVKAKIVNDLSKNAMDDLNLLIWNSEQWRRDDVLLWGNKN